MTGKELVDRMLALGGLSQTTYPFQPAAIYEAIHQAIVEVNKLCPVKSTVQLLHYPLRPTLYQKGITFHKGGEDLEFFADDVRSFAFAVSGTGQAILSSPEHEGLHTFSWNDETSFVVKRGIVDELLGANTSSISLRFVGNYNYLIRDVSFYGELESPFEDDVDVFGDWKGYCMSSAKYLGERFLGFDYNAVRTGEHYIDGECVYLPVDKPGEYEVRCTLKPRTVTADNLDLELDLDPELHILVPLRAAYYFYYITDSEAADRCNAEYQKTLALVMSKLHKVKQRSRFMDLRGW